jgi:hypothetical protein
METIVSVTIVVTDQQLTGYPESILNLTRDCASIFQLHPRNAPISVEWNFLADGPGAYEQESLPEALVFCAAFESSLDRNRRRNDGLDWINAI